MIRKPILQFRCEIYDSVGELPISQVTRAGIGWQKNEGASDGEEKGGGKKETVRAHGKTQVRESTYARRDLSCSVRSERERKRENNGEGGKERGMKERESSWV